MEKKQQTTVVEPVVEEVEPVVEEVVAVVEEVVVEPVVVEEVVVEPVVEVKEPEPGVEVKEPEPEVEMKEPEPMGTEEQAEYVIRLLKKYDCEIQGFKQQIGNIKRRKTLTNAEKIDQILPLQNEINGFIQKSNHLIDTYKDIIDEYNDKARQHNQLVKKNLKEKEDRIRNLMLEKLDNTTKDEHGFRTIEFSRGEIVNLCRG